ncbi:protein-disulfide reductase DsbD family protein [Imtechella halotolerans]|uniref:Thiol:disulfide interchange protein n=1 Tax=Imtechella halotolerans K1 TaxID=946077 RepID=I0W7C9_9FLAO|nr:cytochrome c biogenesis protein CcdA [Imtechella halotolerans]EID72295.1 thiol:disulfide interchange protein [Imtechella halotolerans K1]WMQ64397.1 cytochrome c biogenesis protein CcdA [Imtechella halotolerans]
MRISLFFLVVLSSFFSFSQMGNQQPVKWKYEVEQLSDAEYKLILKGTIDPEWHVYSQFTPEGGALPTELTFEGVGVDFELLGAAQEGKTYTQYSEIFEVDETFFKNEALITQHIRLLNPEIKKIRGNIFYQACIDVCINLDEDFVFSLDGSEASLVYEEIDERSKELSSQLKLPLKNVELLQESATASQSNTGLWGIFILGFLGGLLALLTPCVFPMIPLTVSFFTKQNKSKGKGIANAILYGFFILLIYVLLSIPFHFLDSIDPEILNTISTNIWLNVAFFIIFLFFAFSFFGYYELTLPSSWSNKMDNASNIGGIVGIFFMAVTLALVSFSCTGPILGSLLAGSLTAEGGAMQLTAGMAGFGVALALPFALFALFPNWLNSLPKSGGWMTTTKVVLGFLELALAFKFLSNADLVAHWGILKREIFIGIWVLIFILMSLYLFGIIRFPHDNLKAKLSKIRVSIGIISTLFSVYLILGLFGQNQLKLLSGFPPPAFYTVAEQKSDCPLGLNCFKDFETGLAYAKLQNKPIMLDFTGWACVNCRKMEEHVWSDSEVFQLINDEYVLISLYIDDRKELPEVSQFDFQYDSGRVKKIKTIGEKWATFQAVNFHTASQPYYVLLSPELEILSAPQQYTDIETYKNWLEEGIKAYKALK